MRYAQAKSDQVIGISPAFRGIQQGNSLKQPNLVPKTRRSDNRLLFEISGPPGWYVSYSGEREIVRCGREGLGAVLEQGSCVIAMRFQEW